MAFKNTTYIERECKRIWRVAEGTDRQGEVSGEVNQFLTERQNRLSEAESCVREGKKRVWDHWGST